MIGKTIEKYSGTLYRDEEKTNINNDTENNLQELGTYLSNDVNEAKIMIATSLALLVGLIHVNTLTLFKFKNENVTVYIF